MTTLTFQNTTLSVQTRNNQTFLTASDLGTALQYSHPIQNITKIFERNADEFTPEMTALIEMQTNGGKQQVRIFSLRGAHLITMFARTKVAKDFRKWVLDILDKEVSAGTISPEQQQAIQSAVQQAHHRTGLHWQEIYRQIKAIFHAAKYDQLPADQFGNVMAFISNLQKIEQIKPLAPPPKKYIFEFTEDELLDLAWAWFAFLRGIHTFRHIYPVFEKLGSNMAGNIYRQGFEYTTTARNAHKVINRLTKDFQYDYDTNWRVLKHIRNFDPAFKNPTF